MTMPEFNAVARVVKQLPQEKVECWAYSPIQTGSPLFTSTQLNQAYAAGQAELIAAREEIKTLQANLRMSKWERAEVELIEQLATSQADNERLREVISKLLSWIDACADTSPEFCFDYLEEESKRALSTKPDTSAIREHDAKLVERIAGEAPTPAIFEWIRRFADEIREGNF